MELREIDISTFGKIRPRFSLLLKAEVEETFDFLEAKILQDKTVSGVRSNNLIFLKTPSWMQHYWSPEMTIRIEEDEYSDNLIISCLIGPRQQVWAMFTMIYAAIILISSFAGMFGFVQYQTQGFSPFLYLVPFGIIAFSSVFFAAKLGQEKGKDQASHLIAFLYHSLEELAPIERMKNR
jgi:hypothetical protein